MSDQWLQTCANYHKCCVITSVLGEQAYEPSPMAMMALYIVYGHDLMIGSPPCHMHHEQRDEWAPDLCYSPQVLC